MHLNQEFWVVYQKKPSIIPNVFLFFVKLLTLTLDLTKIQLWKWNLRMFWYFQSIFCCGPAGFFTSSLLANFYFEMVFMESATFPLLGGLPSAFALFVFLCFDHPGSAPCFFFPPWSSRRPSSSTRSTLSSRPPCACPSGSCSRWGTPPTPSSSATATWRSATWYVPHRPPPPPPCPPRHRPRRLNRPPFSSSSAGESRLRGQPDRRGGGDAGHHHLGGPPL